MQITVNRVLMYAGVPVFLALAGAVYADVPHQFSDGDVLSAQALNENFHANVTPPGVIVAYAGENAPEGWLLCDGTERSRTGYASLFAAIGTIHGDGDGSTTFNLPDYRGRFLRGVDGEAGRDPDKAAREAPQSDSGYSGNAVGSIQAHAFPQHSHELCFKRGTTGTGYWGVFPNNGGSGEECLAPEAGEATETRPTNAYVNYIIKY